MSDAGGPPRQNPGPRESGSVRAASVSPEAAESSLEQPAPPEETIAPIDGEETRRFLSQRHHAVSSLLSDLAKTARSFILYDPRNDAIRNFLTSLLQSLGRTLEEEGVLRVTVQPFEIWFEGEVVYLNRDRERSLAFRLYRDGVRGLTIQPGFDWGELLQLLQILSVRYTGVQQHEDDVVTLLWKANFKHLDVMAVEGFVPRDDGIAEPPETVADVSSSAVQAQVGPEHTQDQKLKVLRRIPDNVDQPGPHLPEFEAVSWVDVPAERLEQLRDETSDRALPASCLALLWHIRPMLDDTDSMWRFTEVAHLFAEIRDFLLASEQLIYLERLIDMLEELVACESPAWDPWRPEAVRKVLAGCGDEGAVRKLLHSAAVESRKVPPELLRLIERLCPDPLSAVMDSFIAERSASARAFARQLIEHFGVDHIEALQSRFSELPGTVACDLLRAIANIDPEKSAVFIAQQCWHSDPDVQDEALRHLEQIPYSGAIGRSLFEAARRVDPARRLRVFRLILRSKDRRFVDRLAAHVRERGDRMPAEEAEQFGRVMGRLGGSASIPLWREWLEPVGWVRKSLPGSFSQQVAAIAALGEIRCEESMGLLHGVADVAGRELLDWVGKALTRIEGAARRQTE